MVLYNPKSQTSGEEKHNSGSCECGEEKKNCSDCWGGTLSQESAAKEKEISR